MIPYSDFSGCLRKMRTPNIEPQVVGFPCSKDPKKVPLISEAPKYPSALNPKS